MKESQHDALQSHSGGKYDVLHAAIKEKGQSINKQRKKRGGETS